MPHPTHRYVLWLFLLLVAFGTISALVWFVSAPQEGPVRTPPPAPLLTEERTVEAIGTTGFSALASYTDQGFEPRSVTVQNGETIRFTNNSAKPMNLSLSGASDVPQNLPPGEYWEYTFSTSGTFSVTENTSRMSIAIIVQ